jgi:hypothetical protein
MIWWYVHTRLRRQQSSLGLLEFAARRVITDRPTQHVRTLPLGAHVGLMSPWHGSALLLFDLLDQIWRKYSDATPFGWPASRRAYARYLAYYQRLGRALIRQGWAEGWNRYCVM